jgi:peptidoglycan/xylan/chitin deacetylase (PgdA/CDA1 family)
MGARSPRHSLAPAALAACRAVRALAGTAAARFRILLLHDVAPGQRTAFAALIDGLARRGTLITPAEAESRLSGRGGSEPGWLLSFDDGFASNADIARDILAPRGIKALFFVCPGLIDLNADQRRAAIGTNIFDGKRGAGELDLMGWAEVEELTAAGHVVGNHTLGHRRLAGLSPERLAEQVGEGARRLAARLGPVPWFAYTFGDIASIDAAALAEIARHHHYCRSGVRGANGPGTNPLALRGDAVDLSAPAAWGNLEAEGGLDLLYRKQRRRLDELAGASMLPLESKTVKSRAS